MNTSIADFKNVLMKLASVRADSFTPAERFLFKANAEKDMGVFFESVKLLEFSETDKAIITDYKVDSYWDNVNYLNVDVTLTCVNERNVAFSIIINVDGKNL